MATNHIITATFKAGRRKTSTRPISQYDYGQLLTFEGFELPDHYEVQFSNYPNGGATVPQIGDSTGVQIPYSLCATGLPIYAHLFLHDDATDGETVYTVTIPVDGRPYPANGTPTSAEESALSQAITALQAIEPRVDDIEDDIDAIQAEMLTKADATTVQGALNDIADIQEDITTLQTRGIELAEDVSVIGDQLSGKVDKVEGKGLSTEDYTSAEKTKLAGIATGAQVNANGFGTFRVKTGTYQYTNFQAGNPNDVLKITPGANIDMGGYGDELTINAWFPEASQDGAGLMSAADKTAVDGLNDIIASGGISVPHTVRNAILALFESAAYAETGLADEIATIEAWAQEVLSLTLSDSELNISGASSEYISATVVPSTATVTWESSDTSVATVVNGVVTSVSNGSCTITASAGDKSATCTVTVSGFVTLESISAVYTQSGTVYDTDSLDSLKSDLVVTATYSDSSTAVVTTYTLSGTLTEGTSTITVAYGGKTDTFSVTVSHIDTSVVYELPSATTFDGNTDIDTQIAPLSADRDWTINFEMTNFGSISGRRIFIMGKNTNQIGAEYASSNIKGDNGDTATTLFAPSNADGTKPARFVVTHTQGSNDVVFNYSYYATGNSSVTTGIQTVTTNKSSMVDASSLHIGGFGNFGQKINNITLTEFYVRYRLMDSTEITEYLQGE